MPGLCPAVPLELAEDRAAHLVTYANVERAIDPRRAGARFKVVACFDQVLDRKCACLR